MPIRNYLIKIFLNFLLFVCLTGVDIISFDLPLSACRTLTLLAVILGAMMGLAEVTVMSIFYLFLLILILGDDSKKGEEEQAVTEEENK